MSFVDDLYQRHARDAQLQREPSLDDTAWAGPAASRPVEFAPLRELPAIDGESPDLPPELLPAELGDFIFDLAERTGGPPEFGAVGLLCAAGSAIGTRAGVLLKARDSWIEIPNLWGLIVGTPGSLKTPLQSQALAPMRRADGARREEWETNTRPHLARRLAEADIVLAGLSGKAMRGADAEALANARTTRDSVDQLLRAGPPRLSTSDATPEKLAELLQNNPAGILTERDELSGWLGDLDREGRQGARAFYLEGWGGRGSFDVDRIQRGSRHVPRVALSVLGGIQPGPLLRYVAEATGGGPGADGLLQRFQLVAWPNVREFRYVDREPDPAACAAVDRLFVALLSDDLPARIGACEHFRGVVGLRLSPDAQDFFSSWYPRAVGAARAEKCAPFAAWLAKVPKLLAGVAIILYAADVVAGRTTVGVIPLSTLQLAAAWCGFVAEHAAKVFGAARHPEVAAAHALLAKIRAGAIEDGETLRDLNRAHWRGLSSSEGVAAGIEVLVAHGHVTVEKLTTDGRSSSVVRLNPAVVSLQGRSAA